MTITIDNLMINNNAPAGTVIGVLTGRDAAGNVILCNYRLTKGASGFLPFRTISWLRHGACRSRRATIQSAFMGSE
jgi:hypothetical protein